VRQLLFLPYRVGTSRIYFLFPREFFPFEPDNPRFLVDISCLSSFFPPESFSFFTLGGTLLPPPPPKPPPQQPPPNKKPSSAPIFFFLPCQNRRVEEGTFFFSFEIRGFPCISFLSAQKHFPTSLSFFNGKDHSRVLLPFSKLFTVRDLCLSPFYIKIAVSPSALRRR